MSKENKCMKKDLKEYLTSFFVYTPDSLHNERLLNRPYKWQGIKEDINLINSLDPTLVLDLGCGDNRYKNLVKNLTGIDIAPRPNVDIVGDFTKLNFENNTVDAIIAYGSINFGDTDLITQQLTEAKRVLKENGIICFRALSTNDKFCYNWTEERINYFSKLLEFKMHKEPTTIYRINQKGEINENWKDRRSVRYYKNESKKRKLTRLHWIWKK